MSAMRLAKWILVSVVTVGPAFSGSPPIDRPNADARGAYSAKLEGCAERGGVPAHGPFGETYCRIRYHDGGKLCTDNAQCTGGCVYRPTSGPLRKPEGHVVGTCKRANVEFGCFGLVAHGRVEHLFCVD
jgi:hypothetical protein